MSIYFHLISIPYQIAFIWFICTVLIIPVISLFKFLTHPLVRKIFLLDFHYLKRFLITFGILLLIGFWTFSSSLLITAL